MRLAIISDTHFGDPMSQLARIDKNTGEAAPGPKYEDFRRAVGDHTDYLILLGDILDFSICSYAEAYRVAKAFFERVQQEKIAQYIVYVPGNHDGDLWQFYEHQVNVINRITDGRPPRDFRFSVPAIIDGRIGTPLQSAFSLFGVNRNPKLASDPIYKDLGYGGMFLDNITLKESGSGAPAGKPLPFAFANPNVYIVTDRETVMLTHGHYFEGYWSMLGEWALKIAGPDLQIGDALDLAELVALNFPLNQLACTGVGQAGPLTRVVQKVQREFKDNNLNRIKTYLDRLDDGIDELTKPRFPLDPREAASDAAANYFKKKIIEKMESSTPARFDEKFIHRPEVLERFRKFLDASLLEVDAINAAGGPGVAMPRYVVFGHTHEPIPWGAAGAPKTISHGGRPVTLYNTGGWLNGLNKETGQEEFCGAEVMVFDNCQPTPWISHAIR